MIQCNSRMNKRTRQVTYLRCFNDFIIDKQIIHEEENVSKRCLQEANVNKNHEIFVKCCIQDVMKKKKYFYGPSKHWKQMFRKMYRNFLLFIFGIFLRKKRGCGNEWHLLRILNELRIELRIEYVNYGIEEKTKLQLLWLHQG